MGTIFTASVVAALVSAVVTIWQTQKRISIENITQDRREWRQNIRKITPPIYDALIQQKEELIDKLRTELRVMLNPDDELDNDIIDCVEYRPEENEPQDRAEEFAERMALLLKHDWERAKVEAGSIIMRIVCVRSVVKTLLYEPKRIRYKKCCKRIFK